MLEAVPFISLSPMFVSAFHVRLGSRVTQIRPAMYIRHMVATIDTRVQDPF